MTSTSSKMRWLLRADLAVLLVGIVSGCASTDTAPKDAGVAGPGGKAAAGGAGAAVGRYGGPGGGGVSRTGSADPADAAGPLGKRVIYFEYDSYDVLPEYQPVVAAHAGYLASRAGRTVTLEGHGDERGSSEYNIALGEQRARAVARLMELQGVGEDQIQIVSYGEEKPATSGHDEAAWRQNRRVEIHYAGE